PGQGAAGARARGGSQKRGIPFMKVLMAQLNPTVGDLEGNLAKLREALTEGRRNGADLVLLPELFLVGYPPRDLLELPWFLARTQRAVEEAAAATGGPPGPGLVFGAPLPNRAPAGRGLQNAAFLAAEGKILGVQAKTLLPFYDVFDE